ncbi:MULTISPECIES: LysR family transcriptional regulator [unclassified Halomonas]|uniref:LysR family transcriptional regulator n=1 Tax=unclassified Halomonas TaxID=2609666 RepID=UPI001CF4BF7B|nr:MULTISPECIES: LysR family transcriptional regulator [unclassified Halomonas]MCA8863098.1 LysR family transcriptional regulator [Halomonas sp. SBBP1]UZH09397.1 LysR family transcriptional regulator [Halomonas sp. BDJS001]
MASLGQMSDYEIRLIRIFKTVVECGGFTAAETTLGISRSAISQHMNDLEGRLGFSLCQRGRGGFSLTEEGKEIYQAGLTLLTALETFKSDVNALHQTIKGELNIGITDNLVTLPAMHVTNALTELSAAEHEVTLHIHMEPSDAVIRGVMDGHLHVGVVPAVNLPTSLEARHLYDEPSYLYCAAGHPLFTEDDDMLSGEDIAQHAAISPRYPLPVEARQAHDVLSLRASASDREGAAFLILTGRFIGFLPEHVAAQWVAAGKMRALHTDTQHYRIPFVLITRHDRRPNRVVDAFLRFIKSS